MIAHEVPEMLVDWVQDMLAYRNLTVNHGDTTTAGKPDNGPQGGGGGSTPLGCFVVNDLSEDLQNEGFRVYDYADDTAMLVRGNFLSALRDLMINARKTVQRWWETKGLTV
jgi:hypothetical protein